MLLTRALGHHAPPQVVRSKVLSFQVGRNNAYDSRASIEARGRDRKRQVALLIWRGVQRRRIRLHVPLV